MWFFLAFGLVQQAQGFGDMEVDREAEHLGLLNGCFKSRVDFFRCCGKFRVSQRGAIRPSSGCFPKGLRQGSARERPALDPYRRAYKRCCDEPLSRHRRMLTDKWASAFPNYTLLHANPFSYFDNTTLWLPGFRTLNLGAASMSESFRSLHRAVQDFSAGRRIASFSRSQYYFRHGKSHVNGLDGEDFLPVFHSFRSSKIKVSYTFLDVGAADGMPGQSPLFGFMEEHRSRVRGVALEGREAFCARYREAWPEVEVQCGNLSAQSLYDSPPSLQSLKPACSHAYCVDVWKVDIDSIDCTVLEVLLTVSEPELLPKAVILEVNPHYPPPYKFSMLGIEAHELNDDFWTRTMLGLYGCSLSHQVAFLHGFGYWLIGFHHKDALYVHKDFAHALGASEPLDEFLAYSNAIIMTGSGVTPPTLRRWLTAPPHIGLGLIQQYLKKAQKHLARQVSFSLSI